MNERIKKIRKVKGLSQEKFGEQLGVTKTSISRLEAGINNVTDTMAKLICSEYNVNLEWLKSGQGKMFIESDTISLDEYAKAKGATNLEINIVKSYFELDPNIRKLLIKHFKSALSKEHSIKTNNLSVVAEQQSTYAAHNDAEIDDEEIKLMKQDLDEL